MARQLSEDWIESFVKFARDTEPRESFRRWTAISTIASSLQRKCYLKWGSETFYPNMYIVLIGPPAARKGTAMREGKKFLNKMGLNLAADESSRQKLIGSLKESQATEQSPSGGLNMHASMTIFSSELTVFLGYESKDMLSMLCKWYDCEDRFVYDTYGRGREEIPNVWANLFGATTPQQLQTSLPEGAVGSGFTSRVVFIYEDDKGKVVIKPQIDESMEEAMLLDIGEIRNIYGPFHMEAAGEELYACWRNDGEQRQLFSEPRLDYYVQRRPTHLFKLAMIYSAARTNERIILQHDVEQAIQTLEDAEKKMPHVFEGVGMNPLAGLQTRISRVLAQRKTIPLAELAEMFSNDASYMQLGEALNSLDQMGHAKQNVVDKIVHYTRETQDAS